MSAFVCDSDHFKALAIFAVSKQYGTPRVRPQCVEGFERMFGYEDLQLAAAYADILMAENIRSVMHRYPNSKADELPGPAEQPEHIRITRQDMGSPAYRLPAIALLKMCDCLDYQSCETDDWRQTPAYALLNAIRCAAITDLPGYGDAPWDFNAAARRTA